MKNRLIALLVLFTVIFFSTAQAQTTARKFEAGKNTFLLDGKPFVVKAAELHYTRIPQAYWEPYRDVQSVGNEYDLYLYFLEYP